MDSQQQHSSIAADVCIQDCSQLPPAQLWIGSHDKLVARVHEFLQRRWCSNNGCGICAVCKLIVQHQHYGAVWIAPDGTYTRDDLEPIFQTIQFALDGVRELFFVIQKADYLTPSCYNSLLKSIEEPPHGYHFILLSERFREVAQTVRSRCAVQNFSSQACDVRNHPLAMHFLDTRYESPIDFMQTLTETDPNERETVELIDVLLAHWISSYKQSMQENNTQELAIAAEAIQLLESALANPPMSGSSKLFWKNFFVQFKR